MKIALAALNPKAEVSLETMGEAWKQVIPLVELAAQQGASLIVFPELSLTGFDPLAALPELVKASAQAREFGLDAWSQLAQKWGIAICAGMPLDFATFRQLGGLWDDGIPEPVKPLNCSVFWDEQGRVLGVFAKLHAFSLGDEGQFFSSGSRWTTFHWQGLCLGLQVCYDLRFPEICRVAGTVDLWLNLACWPRRRLEHRKILGAARALENRCFLVSVNRSGVDRLGLDYEGFCAVYDPDGSRVPELVRDSSLEWPLGFSLVDVDVASLRKARLVMPALRDKRFDLFRDLSTTSD